MAIWNSYLPLILGHDAFSILRLETNNLVDFGDGRK